MEFQRVGAKTWNTAAERQTGGDDPRLSREVFDKITTPSRAIAFRDEHILDAVKRFPELQGAADALAAAKRKGDAEYDAGTARLFFAKVQAQLLERLSTGEIIQPHTADRAPRSPRTITPRPLSRRLQVGRRRLVRRRVAADSDGGNLNG